MKNRTTWHERRGLAAVEEFTVLLKLPDNIRQAESYDCGPICYSIVMTYLGITPREFLADPIDGLHPSHLQPRIRSDGREQGIRTQSGEMTIADLTHHTAHGRPVICLIQRGTDGHYVVVRGVSRGTVYYVDPVDGNGKLKTADWLARWHDCDSRGHGFDRWGLAVWRE